MTLIAALNRKFKIVFTLKHLVADFFNYFFFLSFPNKWSVLVADRFNRLFYSVSIKDTEYHLLSNTDLLLYRSKTFHDKEPETNKWIEKMPSDGVFYDVGANVGIFSILASAFCKKVYAFEPSALNYSVLNQNLMVNSLEKKVTAYCLAINDKFTFDTMRLSSGTIGSAHHTFGINKDACHNEFSPFFHQGSLGISLDELVYTHHFDCPTYLKIDVDGNEHLVIQGATKILKDSRLKSILIELNKNLKIDQDLISYIEKNGFHLTEVGQEALLNGMRIGNLIFHRNES
jgi:FkbM family methyltransferase